MSKDIINEILGDLGDAEHNNNNNVFFTEDSAEGYFGKRKFISDLRTIKGTPGLKHLQTMFNNMSLKKNMMGMPKEDFINGESIIWVRFQFGNVKQNLPIPNFGRMNDFITDYANGIVKSVLTLEKLIEAAAEEK